MSTMAAGPVVMTTEELLALPEDGMERELIRGQLKEREMSRRGIRHTWSGANITTLLRNWVRSQPAPHGRVLVGEAGFRLARNPDTTVGIDIAYISAPLAASVTPDTFLIDGVPVLAVEILSPSDRQQDITDKVAVYLALGVPLVWVVETVFQTVTVYRPDGPPEMFNLTHQLDGGPHLPGFRADVAEVFAD
jgi:Uma2 family endonuclease